MLVVRHLSGPLKGKGQTLDGELERVVFGRDPEVCQVVYPPEETLVSRRHFALLRKPSGEWTVDLFGAPYVAINGEPAEAGQPVRTGDTIELGKRGGPSFEVVVGTKRGGEALPLTQAQERMQGSREMARSAKRLALAGVAVAAVAVIGAGLFWHFTRTDAARLDRAVAGLAEAQTRAAAESIGAGVRDRLLQASYVVVQRTANGQESAVGTASPIAENLLATNAHIVEIRDKMKPGSKLLVRSPGPNGRTFEVIDSQMHPGYAAFQNFLDEDPFFVVSSDAWLKASLSYDVGTLRVADGSNLSPILDIASMEELAALRPGTPMVMAGYPLERIAGSEVQAIGATPTLSIGMITALTDMFNLPADPAYRRLVQHNLPGTGGNSGSPMLNANGKIVALHNSGSYINVPNVGRVPNAAMVRFGQRADFLHDVISGRAAKNLDQERAYWAKQTAAFKRGFDVLVPYILSQRAPASGAKPTLVSQSKFALVRGDAFKANDKDGKEVSRRQKIHPVTLKAGRPATYIAYAQEKARIQLYLVIDGRIVEQHDRNTWFPHIQYQPERDGSADIYVVGADNDVNYTLIEYSWAMPQT